MTHRFRGYHGTSYESALKINDSNYESSLGDEEWLGDGVYFFIDGISSNPDLQAKDWAIAQSWDNINKVHRYTKYCVIKSIIEVEDENFLDLTKEDGVILLKYFLDCYHNKIKQIKNKLDYIDGCLINLARGEGALLIDVAKGNFYIKFKEERIKNINLRTSNCTICCVYNPINNLITKTIVNTGDI